MRCREEARSILFIAHMRCTVTLPFSAQLYVRHLSRRPPARKTYVLSADSTLSAGSSPSFIGVFSDAMPAAAACGLNGAHCCYNSMCFTAALQEAHATMMIKTIPV
jgi:hypothetical protein